MRHKPGLQIALRAAGAGTSTAVPGAAQSNSNDLPVLFAANDDDQRKVTTQRRRRTDSSGERRRATAPQRRKTSSGGPSGSGAGTPRPPSGGAPPPPRPSGGLPVGGGLPGGGRMSPMLLIGVLVVLVICVLPLFFFFGGSDDGGSDGGGGQAAVLPPVDEGGGSASSSGDSPGEIAIDESFVPPATSGEGESWLVLLYQDADDKILEQDIYLDLNEAERIGSSDRVQIVAQVDRYRGGFSGDGDWTSTRRFYITADPDLNRVRSQQIMDLGEVNMAEGETLVDFVTWAVETFPADRHVLILSDHGMGWPGGWSDPATGGRQGQVDGSIPLARALGNQLYLMELDAALGAIRQQTGIDKFELVGMDACLMGHLEVFSALEPHARYAVASQEVEPALGWAYTGFLQELIANPDMTGAQLSQAIVDTYIDDDQRIVDDQARAEMTSRGGMFSFFGAPSREEVARQLGQSSTLTAVDLGAIPALVSSVDSLAFSLQGQNQRAVAQARQYAQSYTSIFGQDVEPSYIDLGHFVQILQENGASGALGDAATQVMAALERAVVAEKHGPKKAGSNGVSVYFPNSQLYRSPAAGPESYTAIARRFAETSLWDDFLAYHYTGREFDAAATTVAIPDRDQVSAPGAGAVTVSAVAASSDVAAPGAPITLSADVSGETIGYIKFFTGFYDEVSNAIFVADIDYLESPTTRAVDGVFYPDWGEGDFTVEFTWEPIVFAISDGREEPLVLLNPQEYGATPEETIYAVDGIYTYQDGEQRAARMTFQDGQMQQVFGFLNPDGTGAVREIIPTAGDTFTVLETWLDLDAQGRVAQRSRQEGSTLTFGSEAFFWEEFDAAPGTYVVGFIVEDLDGNAQQSFTQVTVE